MTKFLSGTALKHIRGTFCATYGSNSPCQNKFLVLGYQNSDNQLTVLNFQNSRKAHSDESRENQNVDKTVPSLVYVELPWKYFKNRVDLLRLKLFWDNKFNENNFIQGTKQAVVVMTEHIRNQNAAEIRGLTTPLGYQQITKDMVLSKNDFRLQLLKLRVEDIQKAIPARIYFLKFDGGRHCIVDMFFATLRNTKDASPDEVKQMQNLILKYDKTYGFPKEEFDQTFESSPPSRIVFAEILTRFHRNYSRNAPSDWSVAYYKVATFDVLAMKNGTN